MRRLDESGLLKKPILIELNPAKEEDILLVHSKRHFETNAARGGFSLPWRAAII